MPNLKEFIEAMSASWPVALATFIGSAAVLIGDAYGLAYLEALSDGVLGATFIAAALSGAIVVVSIIKAIAHGLQKLGRSRRREKWKIEHRSALNYLPDEERDILYYVAARRTQVFLAPLNHHRLEPLTVKRYVEIAAGSHDILNWPYVVPEHIWLELLVLVPDRSKDCTLRSPFGSVWEL